MEEVTVSLPVDEEGYLGRECAECQEAARTAYFKIMPGTGLPDDGERWCPYCGHRGDAQDFATEDQIEYAKSVVARKVSQEFLDELKELETDTGFLRIRVEGKPFDIEHYVEKSLETRVTCDVCTLKFEIYGVFAFCPDCGARNTLQTLRTNLDLARKVLDLANQTADPQMARKHRESALGDLVSAFDGFGREACANTGGQARSFQNLAAARQGVQTEFGKDFASGLSVDEWASVVNAFQKRHVLAHRAGVVDQKYIDATGDRQAVVGRRLQIDDAEVRAVATLIDRLGADLLVALQRS